MGKWDDRTVDDLRMDVACAVGEGVPIMEYLRRRVERNWSTAAARGILASEAARKRNIREGFDLLFGEGADG